jgi:hypothetical protein
MNTIRRPPNPARAVPSCPLTVGRALRDQDPGLVIAYGGPSAPLPDGSTPTIRLPDDLRDAVAALRTALGAAPSR